MRLRRGRPRWWAIAAVCLVCGIGLAYAVALDWTVQGWDDASYILIARSLASGNGYGSYFGYGVPFLTTPMLPFLLTPIWLLHPTLPAGVTWFKLVPLACALLSAPVLIAYFVRLRRVAPVVAVGIVVLALLTRDVFTYAARLVMTELPYLLLSSAALYLAHRTLVDGKKSTWRWIVLAVALAAACLTRTVGFALVGACVGHLLWRRRWREGLVLAGLVALFLLPWQIYIASLRTTLVAPEQYRSAFLLREYGKPELGEIQSYWELAPRVWSNLWGHVTETVPDLLLPGLQGAWIGARLQEAGLSWFGAGFGVLVSVLITIGWAVTRRRDATPLEWYVPLYAGVILLPPWYAARNVVPVLPFLLYYLWAAWEAGASRLGERSRSFGWLAFGAAVVAFAVMLVSNVASDRHLIQQGIDARAGRFAAWEQNYYEAGDWLEQQVPDTEPVAAPIPWKMSLYLDRPVARGPVRGSVDEQVAAERGVEGWVVLQPDAPRPKYASQDSPTVARLVRSNATACRLYFESREVPRAEVYRCSVR
jgi:heme exporter protein D